MRAEIARSEPARIVSAGSPGSPAAAPVPPIATGRGFAYAQRGQTIVALAVQVEVNRATGRVRPRR